MSMLYMHTCGICMSMSCMHTCGICMSMLCTCMVMLPVCIHIHTCGMCMSMLCTCMVMLPVCILPAGMRGLATCTCIRAMHGVHMHTLCRQVCEVWQCAHAYAPCMVYICTRSAGRYARFGNDCEVQVHSPEQLRQTLNASKFKLSSSRIDRTQPLPLAFTCAAPPPQDGARCLYMHACMCTLYTCMLCSPAQDGVLRL